jgi:hypothetical protein
MTLIRKFWWLALLAGGWLLAHQAHATDFDAMRNVCFGATMNTKYGEAKFKNLKSMFGPIRKSDPSDPVVRFFEPDVQMKNDNGVWVHVDVTCDYDWMMDLAHVTFATRGSNE